MLPYLTLRLFDALRPGPEVRSGSCVTSIAGPHGGMQLYER
jgi:hypothetical protein